MLSAIPFAADMPLFFLFQSLTMRKIVVGIPPNVDMALLNANLRLIS